MRAIVRTKQFKPKPANPQADPRFKNVKNKANQTAKNLKIHPSAKQKSDEAAKAAKGPPNEKAAGAKANKVDSMKETKAETPPADSFLAVLRAEIEKVMPSNIEDADNFMDGGAEAEMKGAVKGNVKEQKDTASGDLQAATNAPPNEGGVPAKVAAPVPPDPNVPRPALNGGSAMPAPMPDSDISQKQTKADAQTAIKENRLDGKRGQNKHPAFEKVKSEKGNVERTADASPGKFRAGEKQTLGKAATQATVMGRTGMSSVVSVKNKSKSAVKSRQDAQKQKDELRRKAVTDHIEKIYNDTKKDVDANLNSLERDVMAIFDSGSSNAIAAFKRNTNRDIDEFYEDRYSGVGGKLDWIADKFKDTPPRVKQIIQENLKLFTKSMDALAVRVAGLVDKRLNKAKTDIASGEAKIKAFVKTLPKDLKAVGKEAEKAMKSRFDEMREGIEAKKNDLAQKLAQKYKEAHDQANELAKKIEEENKGAFKKLADAIGEIIKIIMEFKDKLMALLRKAADAIELILDDPIGFLGNLIGAIKQGVNQFVGKIWEHLKAGFMKWLFGSLADAGIEIPKDLSLVSLFKMVMSVLGLTIPRLKAKAVKMLGPTTVAVIEKLVEYVSALITGGPAKLWEQVKADVGDLKVMIIDAIQDWLIKTIIEKATIKLLSFFNPAGAFIQALMAIYNTVMFVIENAAKIMAFVEAVIDSVSAIAKGAIGAAASKIEDALASMIPLLIGFLARLIGLGGISQKIKEFITKVQGKVDKAIDKVIGKIVQTVKKLFGKLTGKGKKEEKKPKAEEGKVQLESVGFSMTGAGHTLSTTAKGGKVKIMMASSAGDLVSKIGSATAEVNAKLAKKELDAKTADKIKSGLVRFSGFASSLENELNVNPPPNAGRLAGLQTTLGKLGLLIQEFGFKHKLKDLIGIAGTAGTEALTQKEETELGNMPGGPALLQKINNATDPRVKLGHIEEARVALSEKRRGAKIANVNRTLPRELSPSEISDLKKKHHQQALVKRIETETDPNTRGNLILQARQILGQTTPAGDLTELDVETPDEIIQVMGEAYSKDDEKLEARHVTQVTKTVQEAEREFKRLKAKNPKAKPRKVIVHLTNLSGLPHPRLISKITGMGSSVIVVEVRIGRRF